MMTRLTSILVLGCVALSVLTGACDNNAKSAHSNDDATASNATTHQQADTAPAAAAQPAASKEPASIIPEFTFHILKSGIRFTKEDLAKTGNRVFILFDPTCGHCQHEANDIGKHYDEVKTANFYFVSMNDPALMASFLDTWAKPLVGKENVEVLYDRSAEFINKFHIPSQYPATYVYGADGQLKEYWNGERNAAEIVKAINK